MRIAADVRDRFYFDWLGNVETECGFDNRARG
jgi:hypothetical protein